MRIKLAKYVKGVREKKTSRDKKRTFHRVSPSITGTLAFILCTTLFPITRYTRNEKYKKEYACEFWNVSKQSKKERKLMALTTNDSTNMLTS